MTQHHAKAGSLYTRTGARKYLTPAERRRFLKVAWTCERADLKTLALTIALTGCRISEALALTAASIEAEDGFIALRSLKRRKRAVVIREVPVPDALLTELVRNHDLENCPRDRRLWTLSRSRAWYLIKHLMARAGVAAGPHATPKGLRHGFGLQAVRSGVPINLVQRWLGHASITTSAIYLQAMGDEEREIASRMWRNKDPAPRGAILRPATLLSSRDLPVCVPPQFIIDAGLADLAKVPVEPFGPDTGPGLPITALGRWRWVLVPAP